MFLMVTPKKNAQRIYSIMLKNRRESLSVLLSTHSSAALGSRLVVLPWFLSHRRRTHRSLSEKDGTWSLPLPASAIPILDVVPVCSHLDS
ncbi:hypothetical protein K1719_012130 [Acacia pycnantha]|nr:hypothetical protein K1719_012130 [Acacia pycnantha]